jgi:hypothetical protein
MQQKVYAKQLLCNDFLNVILIGRKLILLVETGVHGDTHVT